MSTELDTIERHLSGKAEEIPLPVKAKRNGHNTRVSSFRAAIRRATTPEEVVQVIDMIKSKALEDQDLAAAKLWLEYTVGKPLQETETRKFVGVAHAIFGTNLPRGTPSG